MEGRSQGKLHDSPGNIRKKYLEAFSFYFPSASFMEKEMATHSSILAWRIPWTESLAGYSPQGCKELDTTEQHTHTHTHTPPCRQLLWTETHRRPDLDAKESGRQVNSVSLLRAKVEVAPLVYSLATFSESEVQSLFWIASSRPRVGDLHPANTGSFSLGG